MGIGGTRAPGALIALVALAGGIGCSGGAGDAAVGDEAANRRVPAETNLAEREPHDLPRFPDLSIDLTLIGRRRGTTVVFDALVTNGGDTDVALVPPPLAGASGVAEAGAFEAVVARDGAEAAPTQDAILVPAGENVTLRNQFAADVPRDARTLTFCIEGDRLPSSTAASATSGVAKTTLAGRSAASAFSCSDPLGLDEQGSSGGRGRRR